MLQREDLARDNPSKRTPRRRKEEDIDADKCDARLLRSNVVHDDGTGRVLARGQSSKHRYKELGGGHPYGTPKEQRSTAELIDSVQAGESREHVDHRRDDLDNKGIFQSGVFEVLRS